MKCKFHPVDQAVSYCQQCDVNLCNTCSDETFDPLSNRDQAEKQSCFICQSPVAEIIGTNGITPFWNRLSKIYLYPLSFDAIATIIFISFIGTVFSGSLIAMLFTTLAISLYSFTCLRQTAQGDFDAPGLDACFEGSIASLFYVLLVVLAAILSTIFIGQKFGAGFALFFGAFYVCSLPAAIIIIAVEGSLMSALDPSKLFQVMKDTGISYFVMLIFILIMVSSLFAASSFFGGSDNSFSTIFIGSFISNYYGIVIYHIMGYLVYQNQDILGYSSSSSQPRQAVRQESLLLKAQLDVLIKAGKYGKASDISLKIISDPEASLWEWSRAFTLNCIGGSEKKITDLFKRYALKLNEANDNDKIADAYRTLLNHHEAFKIQDPQLALLTANSLHDSAYYNNAFQLLRDNKQTFSESEYKNEALELINKNMTAIQNKTKKA